VLDQKTVNLSLRNRFLTALVSPLLSLFAAAGYERPSVSVADWLDTFLLLCPYHTSLANVLQAIQGGLSRRKCVLKYALFSSRDCYSLCVAHFCECRSQAFR